MGLPQEFEEDEVREGFYVNGMMKKIWAAQIDMLDFLNDYCKMHNIRWFMAYGTLLGAVRHQGFIPWDDDCDIWMLRGDFNRLINLLNKEKNCSIRVRESRLADYDGYIPILTNMNLRISFKEDFLRRNHDEPYATTIDIFVLDYYSRNQADEEWRDTAVKAAINVRLSLEALDEENEDSDDEEASGSHGLEESKADILSQGKGALPFEEEKSLAKTITLQELEDEKDGNSGYQEVMKALNDLILLTNHNFSKTDPLLPQINLVYTGLISYFTDDEADIVKSYPNHLFNGFPGLDKHLFDQTIELPFEGRMYPAPKGYDRILRSFYGDYMKKVIGGADHTYPFFLAFENKILTFNQMSFNPFHFQLKRNEMPDQAKKIKSPKDTIRELLSILEQLQDAVDQYLTKMDLKTIPDVFQNLQNVSIRIGNQIEESRNSDHICITRIQEYCDLVYQSFDLLTKGELTAEDLKKQRDSFQKMIGQIHDDYLNRKEVLFLLDRRKNWKALESLWKVFAADTSCDVYVMMMPYFYKKADSSLKEEKHMDPANLPPEVQVVNEEAYPIALHHPDLVFTVNGYDYYNYIRSVSPEFYTRILWQCTDQLVYIPWFMIDAFHKSDPQWATVPFFAQIPGIVYADKTIVQSDAVRGLYTDAAEDMDESIPRSYWEDKIQSWGSPLTDTEDSLEAADNIYRHLIQAMESSDHNA